METTERKTHWETIYTTKDIKTASWYQETPTTSLALIKALNLPKEARIIDLGGGDSFLVDHLLDMGFKHITVVDISNTALEKAKKRLGERADQVNWITADIADFSPSDQYDLWHDRAAFHFLTTPEEISGYINTLQGALTANGKVILGTFSDQGPLKCSGLPITQYSKQSMAETLSPFFEKEDCFTIDHATPFNTVQNFTFCQFKRSAQSV